MKSRIVLLVALAALLPAGATIALGYKPVKLYAGDKRPDSETSALIHGHATEKDGEMWVAMLVGVDGVLCKPQLFGGDNGPTPKNLCGNISVVDAGAHDFIYALQTANQVTLPGPYSPGSNSWNRLDHFVTAEDITVEPGTIYAARPVYTEGGWTVSLEVACKSSNFRKDAQWFISRRICP